MTQNCDNCISQDALFEIDCIEYQRNLLDIALDQLNCEAGINPDRIEILISSYLQHIEPHLDNLRMYLKNIPCVVETLTINALVDELRF